MGNTIDQTQQVAQMISDRGILIVIAALFLIGVIFNAYNNARNMELDRKERKERDEQTRKDKLEEIEKAEARTERLTCALGASTRATEENTKIYQNTLKMHEKMDADIVAIREEMSDIRSEIETIKSKVSESNTNVIELVKTMNELIKRYDVLTAALNDKLDILLETKAS